jgi:hypothetical protein
MANSDGAKPNHGAPAEPSLPMVVSPKLDGSEEAVEGDKETSESFGASDASVPLSRSYRFTVLAASLAIAAAIGSMVGALSASRLASVKAAPAASANIAQANTLQAIKAELAELSALKASLEGATRSANGQFAKLADRLDRVERAEIEPATKIAHLVDTVDRLEKRSAAAAETTGSIASSQSAAPTEAKLPDRVLQDWIVQEVRGGRALVASRYGGVFMVASGSMLPGLGRVETIKRQDGQWVVVTGRGVITSDR